MPEIGWATHGGLAKMTLGNGVVEERLYDERQRLTRLSAAQADKMLRGLEFVRDPASRITAVKDLREGVAKAESLSAGYTFDDRYRLTSAKDSVGSTRWAYDDVHKVLAVSSDHGAPGLNVTNRYGEDGAGPDQLTHHGDEPLVYDAAGRLVQDGERTLTWDAKGRLERVERGGTVEEYTYGYDGARAVKTTTDGANTEVVRYIDPNSEERGGKLIRYVFVNDERVARLDALPGEAPSSAKTAAVQTPSKPTGRRVELAALLGLVALLGLMLRALFGSWRLSSVPWVGLIAVTSVFGACRSQKGGEAPRGALIHEVPAGAVFYLSDHQQTPLVLANAAGAVLSATAYHAYGGVRRSTGSALDPHAFVGNERDEGAGLGDFKARPYRADAGIFLAPDPLAVFEAPKLSAEPARLAPYLYGLGDPVNQVDRDGLCPSCAYSVTDVQWQQRVQQDPVGAKAEAQAELPNYLRGLWNGVMRKIASAAASAPYYARPAAAPSPLPSEVARAEASADHFQEATLYKGVPLRSEIQAEATLLVAEVLIARRLTPGATMARQTTATLAGKAGTTTVSFTRNFSLLRGAHGWVDDIAYSSPASMVHEMTHVRQFFRNPTFFYYGAASKAPGAGIAGMALELEAYAASGAGVAPGMAYRSLQTVGRGDLVVRDLGLLGGATAVGVGTYVGTSF